MPSYKENRKRKNPCHSSFYFKNWKGECLALMPADILPDHSIDIKKSFATQGGIEYFMPAKNKEYRNVSIPKFLYDDIMNYIDLMYDLQLDQRIFYFTRISLNRDGLQHPGRVPASRA